MVRQNGDAHVGGSVSDGGNGSKTTVMVCVTEKGRVEHARGASASKCGDLLLTKMVATVWSNTLMAHN
jgi:hypothetical protein